MRDTKSLLLLIVSFLLLVVSCVLLWTWGYRVYQSDRIARQQPTPINNPVKKVPPTQAVVADTLKNTAPDNNTLNNNFALTSGNADSLSSRLEIKLNEFDKLRTEITTILKRPGNNADLLLAKEKIGQLQQIVEELRNRNKDVENENNKLNAMLNQLSVYIKNSGQSIKQTSFEEKKPVDQHDPANGLTTTELSLSGIMMNADKEEETHQAQQTEKLVGAFTVKNSSNITGNTEMMVVVLQPDGQVLKTSAWESGTFTTTEGKKIYSYKIRFEMTRGENRRLLFTLNADKFQKGNYTMQVYYNGVIIGKMVKNFS